MQMLTTFVLTLCVSSILWVMPTFATEFEFGTQFGISHLRPEGNDYYSTNITYTRFPSGTFLDVGSAPTSLYATWFPSKQFAIGPEFSFGRTSVSASYGGESETESITTLHLGGKASYFLLNHPVSSPYLFGRVSHTIFSGEDSFFFHGDLTITGIGIGGVISGVSDQRLSYGQKDNINDCGCQLKMRMKVKARMSSH